MTGPVIAIVALAAAAAMSLVTGQLLYRLAPVAGYGTEADRRHFRTFGYEWGWVTPFPALAYWATQAWAHQALPAIAPTRNPESAVLASRRRRLAAMVIDNVIVFIAAAAAGVPLLLLGGAVGGAAGLLILLAMVLCVFVVAFLYAPVSMMRAGDRRGQTFGKQCMGVWVVRADGAPLTFGTCLLRELVARNLLNLLTGGVYGLVDASWCLFDDRRQTLHDKVAKTIVVTAR